MSDKNNLVNGMVGNFQSKGLEIVYADCPGFKKPDVINGSRPDVIAWDPNEELYHIGNVVDSDEFKPEKLGKTLVTLSSMMMARGKSTSKLIPFYLGVPPKTSEKISKVLDEKRISKENIKTVELGDKNNQS